MQTPKQFIENYLSAYAELQKRYHALSEPFFNGFFCSEYLNYVKNWQKNQEENGETFLKVEASNPLTAIVITVVQGRTRDPHNRYHLRLFESGWKIYDKEHECFVCHGVAGKSTCRICQGKGWTNYKQNLSVSGRSRQKTHE